MFSACAFCSLPVTINSYLADVHVTLVVSICQTISNTWLTNSGLQQTCCGGTFACLSLTFILFCQAQVIAIDWYTYVCTSPDNFTCMRWHHTCIYMPFSEQHRMAALRTVCKSLSPNRQLWLLCVSELWYRARNLYIFMCISILYALYVPPVHTIQEHYFCFFQC